MDRVQPVGQTQSTTERSGTGLPVRTVALVVFLLVCLLGFFLTIDLTGTRAIVGVCVAVLATAMALLGMAVSADELEALPLWVASGCYLGIASTAFTDQAIPLLAAAVACHAWLVLSAWRLDAPAVSWWMMASTVMCFVGVAGLLMAIPNDFETITVTAEDSVSGASGGG